MIDVNRLLTGLVTGGINASPPSSNAGHGPAAAAPHAHPPTPWSGTGAMLGTGALAGGLAGLLTGSKQMRELAGTALQVGAVAAIGGLAYKAYQNYQQGKPVVPQSIRTALGDMLGSGQTAAPTGAEVEAWNPAPSRNDAVARLLLRTMVAAAVADGHLDTLEYGRLRQHLLEGGFDEEEQLLLSQSIMRPPGIDELAAEATTPALRAEVYTAARLAVDPDTPAERRWLDDLAHALQLDEKLRAHLDAIGSAPQSQAA